MATVRVHVLIAGRVQGVGFRWSLRNVAERAGVTGWVRNRADGRVEAELEGTPSAVDAVLDWCRRGPPGARVDDVDTTPVAPIDGADGFTIQRTA